MLNFRKIAADSAGKLVLAYYRELEQADPETSHGCGLDADGRILASAGKLAAYYADRRREANWRPDISPAIAKVLGVDHHRTPKDSD